MAIQYTIRDIPPEIDLKLKATAQHQGISLNKLVLQKLGVSRSKRSKRYHDLDWLLETADPSAAQELQDIIMVARAEARAQAAQEYNAEHGQQV